MSFLLVAPDILQTAAADVARVGSAVTAGNLAAALPTTEVAAAGADEVSAAIAALFGAHAQQYQAVAARAATYHEQFVSTLNAAAASYAGAEATIATSMRGALGAVTAPGTGAAGQAGAAGPLRRYLRVAVDQDAVDRRAPGRPAGDECGRVVRAQRDQCRRFQWLTGGQPRGPPISGSPGRMDARISHRADAGPGRRPH